MGKSPVSVERADCGNGKRKVIVREREYDLLSWSGVKTMGSVLVAVVGIVVAVLTAYYTAEASQNDVIARHAQDLATQKQKVESNERSLKDTLTKFDTTLTAQRKTLDDSTKAIVRIDTRQEILIREVEKINEKLSK